MSLAAWQPLKRRHRLALHRPAQMRDTLQRLHAAGRIDAVPTPFQVFLGVLYMRLRLVTRPDSFGIGDQRVRPTRRARWLEKRPIRLPFLFAERVIAPWDLTGYGSDPAFLRRHVLGAFHAHDDAIYDLALLTVFPGELEALRDEVAAVVDGTHPRAEWLRDLCVYEGYHARLLGLVERALELDLDVEAEIPTDTTLADFAAWMCSQPASPRAAVQGRARRLARYADRQR